MEGVGAKADKALAAAMKLHREQEEKIKQEKAAAKVCRQLWTDANQQCLAKDPDPAVIRRLADDIASRHPDKQLAVKRFLDELGEELTEPNPDRLIGLATLTSWIHFSEALISAQGDGDNAKIKRLVRKAKETYPYGDGIDLGLFRQDLWSKRKADVCEAEARRKEEAKRRAAEEASAAPPTAKPEPQTANQLLWEFEPGLVKFRGRPYDLTPVPSAMLEIFVSNPLKVAFDKGDLRPALRDNMANDDAVRPQLTVLRGVLRKISSDHGLNIADPIPNKAGGWRFLLPRK